MQTPWIIISGILFVASSGLLFNARFRGNKTLLGLAALLAIGSTAAFLYSCVPSFGMRNNPRALNDASGDQVPAPAENTADMLENSAESLDDYTLLDISNPACNWTGGETITACITRLKNTMSEREGFGRAFYSRGTKYFLESNYRDAAEDFTVAIQHADVNVQAVIYIMRGTARLQMLDNEGALDDCNKAADPGDPTTLLPGVAFRRGTLEPLLNECRGVALSRLRRHADALPALNRAIGAGGATWHIYIARFDSRYATGDTAGAQSDWHIATSLLEDIHSARNNSAGSANAMANEQ